ncbi:uncharacterized protein LOC110029556 isoform X3 [Phalaenopsis equestris]|uniref:uncharacterized protein LOC110029556 isoform X3 n=1 Tax=Phalaenopsis equestris TaxID=78828 RepID=UPI0009E2DA4A|nr:uncharacterized protein LOC110029556 isoform X3 [Phalaenopsis equestris]
MPGPGPHIMYALGAGTGLMRLSNGRFTPQHCLFYAANAFLGPDLGSFAEWLASFFPDGSGGRRLGDLAMELIHHPFYYILLLGFPLSFFYAWLSRVLLQKGLIDTISGENGHSSMYTWILSTGWWEGRAPINPNSVLIIGFLCSCLIFGFIYINRVKHGDSIITNSNKSLRLILVVASFYCIWCIIQIYLRSPPQPAVGEEADLGVLVFLSIYFFLPHTLCILSLAQKSHGNEELPL